MGCGSSSLKGDDVPNVNSQPVTAPGATGVQPMKKVKTNFSDINYEQDAQNRRMTEYAPDQAVALVREESRDLTAEQQLQNESDDIMPDRPDTNAGTGPHASADDPGDTTLKPYQTLNDGDWDQQSPGTKAHVPQSPAAYTDGTGTQDPTSTSAKDNFASDNDPANPINQENHH